MRKTYFIVMILICFSNLSLKRSWSQDFAIVKHDGAGDIVDI